MLALIGICVAVHIVSAYLLTENQFLFLLLNAAFIPIRYSGQFDLDISAFTSPLTYAFLHGSIAHLAINMIWLAAFGSPLANRMGGRGSCGSGRSPRWPRSRSTTCSTCSTRRR